MAVVSSIVTVVEFNNNDATAFVVYMDTGIGSELRLRIGPVIIIPSCTN